MNNSKNCYFPNNKNQEGESRRINCNNNLQDQNVKRNFDHGVFHSMSNYPLNSSDKETEIDQINLLNYKDYNPTLPENLITKSSNMPEFLNTLEISNFDERNFMNKSEKSYINYEAQFNKTDTQQTGENLLNLALFIYRKRLSNNEIFIEAYKLKEIIIEIFEALNINVQQEEINQLISSISDFIPKKIIEQGFIDLFNFSQVNDFFMKHQALKASETARFTGNHMNNTAVEDTNDPDISLESLSFVKNLASLK